LYLYTSLHENQHVLRVTGDGDQKDYYISAPSHQHALINPEFEGAFERILFECKVDIVHFQHLIGFPLSLPLISRACGVPSIWTLHDYYLICDRYNLLDFEMKFCDIACKSIDHCDVCLTAGGLLKGSQTRRRNFVSVIVQAFDVLIASTVYTRQYIIGMFPEIDASRIETIEMLMPHARRNWEDRCG
jgi:hypothetical protein